MSTQLLETPDWLSETFTPADDHAWQLVVVISGQHEEVQLPDNGWWDCFCVDCGKSETFEGTITAFSEYLKGIGWCADSLERSTALCRACSNASPELSEEEEREDFQLYEARGK